jgi:hypothetical protein
VTARPWRRALLWLFPGALIVLGLASQDAGLFARLRFAVQRPTIDLPSTTAAPPREVRRGLPLLSLYIDPAHLHDPRTGLFTHNTARGPDWERPASASYFDQGRLLFASGVGVRIHGGISRVISPVQSFKIYLRRRYGADRFAPDVQVFGPAAEPLRRLLAHNDLRADRSGRFWHLVNPLAYDISARIGAKVPGFKPVRFFLNGDWQGVYVLSEKIDLNLDSQYVIAHYGHADFATTNRDFDDLRLWLEQHRPWTLETISRVIDADNLTRWFLSILFCATEDPLQGPQLKDNRDHDGRWFWINWDMDHSFMDLNRQVETPWQHDTFRVVFERTGEARRGRWDWEIRSMLLTTLVAEDEGYRQFFKQLFDETMNYRLTAAFLEERFRHYEEIARTYGVPDREYLGILRDFLAHRPAFLRRLAEQYLDTDASVGLTLRYPDAASVRADGFAVPTGFEGRYFPGATVELAVSDPDGGTWTWLVNGAEVDARGGTLVLRMDRDLSVELTRR